MTHDRRVVLRALLAGLPAVALAVVLLWTGPFQPNVRWTLALLAVGWWLALALTVGEEIVRPLNTISNLIAALREGDYSIRARDARIDTSLGLAFWEINELAGELRDQRMGALEATGLLRRVIAEVDVAIFTFDQNQRLRLVNRAGERLLDRPAMRSLGCTASELGLDICLTGDVPRTAEGPFGGRLGRWEIRRRAFRQDGRPHQLVMLTDLSRALREEERLAWQRIIRVLGHEINNSLAPIRSIARSLEQTLVRGDDPREGEDFHRGLEIIGSRAESLSRFMASYSRLARLPPPRKAFVPIADLVRRVAELETSRPVRVVAGPQVRVQADPDQLEQALINLVSNAVEAVESVVGGQSSVDGRQSSDSSVEVGWTVRDAMVEITVMDDGPGLEDSANLFVPFFTTKPGGSGIGLVLCRQIAEAHGGSLTLENRSDGHGCLARLSLPQTAA